MIQELFDLSNDVAVVTGAGRGIGEGIAQTLAGAGAAVVCAARRTEEIERVAKEIRDAGGRAIAVTTDVTDREAVEALAQAAINEFGSLDIWINNAGGSPVQTALTQLTQADWDACVTLNLTGVWMCTTVAASYMRDGGRVVNISSRAATMPMPGSGHYAACKAGVNSLTQTFAHELGPRIRVNGIMPGAVPTEIMMTALKLGQEDLPQLEKNLKLPMGRLGTPQDLGAAALYLSSPASSWVTGHILTVTGGM
ncbi:MAG: glucose 1-dehydrogenase [Proteobacteria bacterium]|nr:glucose 1-dehydrogenase [Pseudomonadota bacterium]